MVVDGCYLHIGIIRLGQTEMVGKDQQGMAPSKAAQPQSTSSPQQSRATKQREKRKAKKQGKQQLEKQKDAPTSWAD
eukprot:11618977-Prorocentrum_lima.AAC.1